MRLLLRLVSVILLVVLGWVAWPFLQPAAKQAEKRHRDLFAEASQRDWATAATFLASGYEDQWGNRPDEAISLAKELCAGFLVLDIQWETLEVSVNGDIAKVRGHARMEGNGMGVSQMVMTKVNQMQEPWVFTWRKEGWKPSDWKLQSVTNKELEGVGLPSDL